MLTKEQFGDELRVCRRHLVVALVAVTGLWMLIIPLVCDLRWFHSHAALQGALVVLALVLWALSYAVLAKVLYTRRRLVCPSCGDWMGSQSRMLSTGKCPRCKAEVFHES